MPPPVSRIVAPISAWIAAFGLVALTLGGAWFAVTAIGVQPDTPFTEFNRPRVEAFVARAERSNARRVVLLGSSALKYATRDERAFAAEVSREAGTSVETLRVTSNWGTFYDFAPLAEDLLRAEPDLVVMESELLAADRPPVRRFLLWLRDLRGRLGLAVDAETTPAAEYDVQFSYPCWKRKASMRDAMLREERAAWVTDRPDGPGPDGAREFAERLLKSGAEVAIVSVPRHPDYEAQSRITRNAFADETDRQTLTGRVEVWEPVPLPANFYCDLTHVTPAGQLRLSDWLEALVARELGDIAS